MEDAVLLAIVYQVIFVVGAIVKLLRQVIKYFTVILKMHLDGGQPLKIIVIMLVLLIHVVVRVAVIKPVLLRLVLLRLVQIPRIVFMAVQVQPKQ